MGDPAGDHIGKMMGDLPGDRVGVAKRCGKPLSSTLLLRITAGDLVGDLASDGSFLVMSAVL